MAAIALASVVAIERRWFGEDAVPVDVTSEIVIGCPSDHVASYAMDPDNVPKRYENISAVEGQTSPPVRLGSEVAFVAHFLGRRLAYTYEVVEFEVGRRLVMRTADGPFPMETTYTFESMPNGDTRMALRNRVYPERILRLDRPIHGSGCSTRQPEGLGALETRPRRPCRIAPFNACG